MHTIFLPKVKGALVLPVEQTIHVALQVASIPAHNVPRFLVTCRVGVARPERSCAYHLSSSTVELLMF